MISALFFVFCTSHLTTVHVLMSWRVAFDRSWGLYRISTFAIGHFIIWCSPIIPSPAATNATSLSLSNYIDLFLLFLIPENRTLRMNYLDKTSTWKIQWPNHTTIVDVPDNHVRNPTGPTRAWTRGNQIFTDTDTIHGMFGLNRQSQLAVRKRPNSKKSIKAPRNNGLWWGV